MLPGAASRPCAFCLTPMIYAVAPQVILYLPSQFLLNPRSIQACTSKWHMSEQTHQGTGGSPQSKRTNVLLPLRLKRSPQDAVCTLWTQLLWGQVSCIGLGCCQVRRTSQHMNLPAQERASEGTRGLITFISFIILISYFASIMELIQHRVHWLSPMQALNSPRPTQLQSGHIMCHVSQAHLHFQIGTRNCPKACGPSSVDNGMKF